jgi:hypothetical protein
MLPRSSIQEEADPALLAFSGPDRNGAPRGRRTYEAVQEEMSPDWNQRSWRNHPIGATQQHRLANSAPGVALGARRGGRAGGDRRTGEHRGTEWIPEEQQQQQRGRSSWADKEPRRADGREGELAQRAAREQERMGVSIVRRGRGSTATFFTQVRLSAPCF